MQRQAAAGRGGPGAEGLLGAEGQEQKEEGVGGGGSDPRGSRIPRKQLQRRDPSEVFGLGSMIRQVGEAKRTHTHTHTRSHTHPTQTAHTGVHPPAAQADPCPCPPRPRAQSRALAGGRRRRPGGAPRSRQMLRNCRLPTATPSLELFQLSLPSAWSWAPLSSSQQPFPKTPLPGRGR